METKKCFKCEKEKMLDEFYVHKRMKDGRLNKCKDCTKKDTNSRHNVLITDPVWKESEKERHRQKYHRLGYKEKHKPTKEKKKEIMKRYYERYPEKIKSRLVKQKVEDGYNRHHWSYREEHVDSVLLLTIADHNLLHRYLVYDQERMMYRRSDNNILLDTKETHLNYFNEIKSKQ